VSAVSGVFSGSVSANQLAATNNSTFAVFGSSAGSVGVFGVSSNDASGEATIFGQETGSTQETIGVEALPQARLGRGWMEYLSSLAALALPSIPPPAFGAIRVNSATSVFWERQMTRTLCQEPIRVRPSLHFFWTILHLAPLVSSCLLPVRQLVEIQNRSSFGSCQQVSGPCLGGIL